MSIKTLAGSFASLPIFLAILREIGRFPLSISDNRDWVIPSFSASSFCVSSSKPRKPRNSLAGPKSGNTSLTEYSLSSQFIICLFRQADCLFTRFVGKFNFPIHKYNITDLAGKGKGFSYAG